MDVLFLNLVKWLAGLAIPMLLARFVPRRWLVVTLVAWSLLPAFVVLALFLGEVARTPSELAEPGKILLALLFYGGFLIVPWLVMSIMGIVVGLALRRQRARQAEPATTPPRPRPRQQWRARHIGFERDGLILDGLDVWGNQWRRLGTATFELPHPAHPKELHRFEIYEAGDGAQARQFAASELSNGVWGFYTADGAGGQRAALAPKLLVALAILAGALTATGAISFVVVKLTPRPAPALSTVPPMPR
jgi:hypothetical protein